MLEGYREKAGIKRMDYCAVKAFLSRPWTTTCTGKRCRRRPCRCYGMDIHKDTIVVCALPPVGGEGEAVRKVHGTFSERSDPDASLAETT
jgi:hypothetical protein